MVKKVLLIVFGAIGMLVGIGLLIGGAVLVAITGRDGWISSDSQSISTQTYAFLSQPQTISRGSSTSRDRTEVLLRVRARGTTEKPIFIGVGPTNDVGQYLDGVPAEEITDINFSPFRLDTHRLDGSNAPKPPTEQAFWTAKVSGAGEQTLDWELPSGTGDFRFVLMNADASQGVTADVSVGVRVPFLRSLGVGLLVAGIVITLVGLLLLIWGIVTKVPPKVPPGMYPAAAGWPAPGYGPQPPPGYGGPSGAPPAGWPPAQPYGQQGYPGYPGQPQYPGQPGYPGPHTYPGQPGQPEQAEQPPGYPTGPTGPASAPGEPGEARQPGRAGEPGEVDETRDAGPAGREQEWRERQSGPGDTPTRPDADPDARRER
jgi:hypothetical protein